jgi:hypothetical protein
MVVAKEGGFTHLYMYRNQRSLDVTCIENKAVFLNHVNGRPMRRQRVVWNNRVRVCEG